MTAKTATTDTTTENQATDDQTVLVTVDGFTVTANTSVSDDYEFIEALAQIENKSPAGLVNMMRRLFPEEEITRIKDHLRNEHGIVPLTAISEFFKATITELSPNS